MYNNIHKLTLNKNIVYFDFVLIKIVSENICPSHNAIKKKVFMTDIIKIKIQIFNF